MKKEGKSVYCKEEAASLLHFWNLYGRVAGHENNALYDLKISFMGHSIGYFRYIMNADTEADIENALRRGNPAIVLYRDENYVAGMPRRRKTDSGFKLEVPLVERGQEGVQWIGIEALQDRQLEEGQQALSRDTI